MAGPRGDRASILVIEHDAEDARTLVDALEGADYRVWHAVDGQDARGLLDRVQPDLIVAELILPDVDGLVLCSMLKGLAAVPIIICTASARRADPVLALKLGADDYVRKPFEVDDLLARIEAVLRRTPARAGADGGSVVPPRPNALRVADLVVEPARRRALLGDVQLMLTPTEFKLLAALAAHAEMVLRREQLARDVWGYADASNGRTIDVHVRRLRVKLASSRGARSPAIVSVRGTGYRLTAEDTASSAA